MSLNNYVVNPDWDSMTCGGKYRSATPPAWIPEDEFEDVSESEHADFDVLEWAYEDRL